MTRHPVLQVRFRHAQGVRSLKRHLCSTSHGPKLPPPFTGLLRVLACVGNATAVHLFGFNWSAKHYFTHQMPVRALLTAPAGPSLEGLHKSKRS